MLHTTANNDYKTVDPIIQKLYPRLLKFANNVKITTNLTSRINQQPRCKHAGYGALTAERQTIQGWRGVIECSAYPGF
jgi:hypothetical protein